MIYPVDRDLSRYRIMASYVLIYDEQTIENVIWKYRLPKFDK